MTLIVPTRKKISCAIQHHLGMEIYYGTQIKRLTPNGMKPFGAQEQNHTGTKPKVDNVIPKGDMRRYISCDLPQ